MPTADELAAMQRYHDRCLTLVVRLDGVVARATLDEAQHLIDHGEPGIAIEYLARGVTEQSSLVPSEIIRELRELAFDDDDLPGNLQDFAEDPTD